MTPACLRNKLANYLTSTPAPPKPCSRVSMDALLKQEKSHSIDQIQTHPVLCLLFISAYVPLLLSHHSMVLWDSHLFRQGCLPTASTPARLSAWSTLSLALPRGHPLVPEPAVRSSGTLECPALFPCQPSSAPDILSFICFLLHHLCSPPIHALMPSTPGLCEPVCA